MDIADVGNEEMDRWLQGRLDEAKHRMSLTNTMEEEQACRNCQEPLPAGQHYCDRDCAKDWEMRLRAEKLRGKPVE